MEEVIAGTILNLKKGALCGPYNADSIMGTQKSSHKPMCLCGIKSAKVEI